jgi:hypothetical protein
MPKINAYTFMAIYLSVLRGVSGDTYRLRKSGPWYFDVLIFRHTKLHNSHERQTRYTPRSIPSFLLGAKHSSHANLKLDSALFFLASDALPLCSEL